MKKMQRAVYGPMRLTGDVAHMGIGEGDFTIRFTSAGVDKGGPWVLAWSDIHRIDAEFSATPAVRALGFAASLLLSIGGSSGPSMMAKDSVLIISLTSGERVSWSFAVPPSRSVDKWNRKNVKILFDELSSLGKLSLLGGSVAAEQLLVQLGMVQPLLRWQRRREVASIITRIKKR
jgi:hypothetical protein